MAWCGDPHRGDEPRSRGVGVSGLQGTRGGLESLGVQIIEASREDEALTRFQIVLDRILGSLDS